MEIKKINVSGFKNLDDEELFLNKMTGIISINNYGKSNLLKAIEFGFKFINSNNINERKQMMSMKDEIPALIKNYGQNYKFEIELSEVIDNDVKSIIYGYEFCWKNTDEDTSKIVKEYFKVKANESQKYTLLMDRNENKAYIKTSISGRCDKEILIENDNLVINKLRAYDNLYYINLVNLIFKLQFYVDRHFDSSNYYVMNALIDKNNDDLSPFMGYNGSIARILYKLKKEDISKYTLIMNTFKSFFPEIEDVKIDEIDLSSFYKKGRKTNLNIPIEFADYVYALYMKNKYIIKPMNFKIMSDGAKRILTTLTTIILAERNNIPLIAIEEPENSIHPKLFHKYVDVLEQLAGDSKIIITSHSPNLINYMDLNELYLGSPNNEGSALFLKIKPSYYNRIYNNAYDLEVKPGEYLFDLMSSSEDEQIEELKKYLNYE